MRIALFPSRSLPKDIEGSENIKEAKLQSNVSFPSNIKERKIC